MEQKELDTVLAEHARWDRNEAGSKRADLTGVDLPGANLVGANLRHANLTDADLTSAKLTRANLNQSNLARANLTRASLVGARLSHANLTRANLTGANLTRADLTGANLTRADLTGGNLTGADLSHVNLTGATLTDAHLDPIRLDLEEVLAAAPMEVGGLLAALKEGAVNGTVYEGECACLIGTIANVRGCHYLRIPGVPPNSSRPAERWFFAIRPFHTPESSPIVALTVEWIEAWLAARAVGGAA